MKNKLFTKIFVLFLALFCLSFFGCKKTDNRNSNLQNANSDSVKVVSTIFPLYDWTKNIAMASENIKLELLIKNGVDFHSFQPSASDIVKISTCDVLIFVGGESDFWIKNALKNAVNKNMRVINLMEILSGSVKEEEFIEGMTGKEHDHKEYDDKENSEPHNHTLSLAEHEHDKVEYDEHLWLSVKNAETAVQKIADALSEKDSTEADLIETNKDKYLKLLKQLQSDGFENQNDKSANTIVVCDRFPFRYMTDELGIKYYAAFVGCSAETEASFETIAFLSNKIRELELDKVFVTESSDKKIAQTVIKNAELYGKCKIEILDSMQSTTLQDAVKGASYIDIMKENYKKLGKQ